MIRSYSEMSNLTTFKDRFDYCKIGNGVCDQTFGYERYLNQVFYRSLEWKQIRQQVILRDDGCDLGCKDHPISGTIIIHHLNPLTVDDITGNTDYLMNPEYLVCVSMQTHNAIHYGVEDSVTLSREYIPRTPNDTCPWEKGYDNVEKEIQQYVCTDRRTGRRVSVNIPGQSN